MAYKDKQKKLEYARQYRKIHKQHQNAYSKKQGQELKLEVLRHYAPDLMCSCPGCNENYIEFLCVDHIDGGGTKHRDELSIHGQKFYRWLKKNGFPKGYRVLCQNCNGSYGHFGYCPHEKK